MEEQNTVTTQEPTQQNGNEPEKTFTQEEVNRIVQARLAKVKATPQEPDERELSLQRREAEVYVKEQVLENGLPKELIEELKGLDRETADKCIKIIAPYAKKAAEPFLNPVMVGPTGGQVGDTDAIRKAMGLRR